MNNDYYLRKRLYNQKKKNVFFVLVYLPIIVPVILLYLYIYILYIYNCKDEQLVALRQYLSGLFVLIIHFYCRKMYFKKVINNKTYIISLNINSNHIIKYI